MKIISSVEIPNETTRTGNLLTNIKLSKNDHSPSITVQHKYRMAWNAMLHVIGHQESKNLNSIQIDPSIIQIAKQIEYRIPKVA